jgi:hypothetical protein
MRYIKPYQIFEASASAPALTAEQIEWLDKCAAGRWKLNPQTGLVDVDGDFDCSGHGLTDLKGVKFGKVGGYFWCYNNRLTTLVGAPQTVDGDFNCMNNHLTTLEGAPQSVKWEFDCHRNYLTTLEGAPQKIGGIFNCKNNQLTSLVGSPQTVGGYFNCAYNQLTSLEGAPQTVKGNFYCEGNAISDVTLRGIFGLMKNGKSYQQAVDGYWSYMGDEDRVLTYKDKDHSSLSPEDARKYKALNTYSNIKGYL